MSTPQFDFILKVSSRCNLNCGYCYVYNKGDSSWRAQPPIMSDDVFEATLDRIIRHCNKSGQSHVRLIFHGGEPCLIGPTRFNTWCAAARRKMEGIAEVSFSIQTNGTLLDDEWIAALLINDVHVSVSIDGPKYVHDGSRVDHRGQGSFDIVMSGVERLKAAGIPLHVLSVVQLGGDGLSTHKFFLNLGVSSINYLMPDYTHDDIDHVRRKFGSTPCADFLLPILENWWSDGFMDVRVSLFWHISRLILGGSSRIDLFGNGLYNFAFIEANGSIEGLDVLRICVDGLSGTGLHVAENDFTEIAAVSELHRKAMFDGIALPKACEACVEWETCGGGHLPHRFEKTRGFDNQSVWCADILAIFGRLRELLNVTGSQTTRRRELILDLAGQVSN